MKSVLNAGFDQMRSSKTKVDVIFWEMKDIERTLKELRYNTTYSSSLCVPIGHVYDIPTMQFVAGISKIMHCGILINSPCNAVLQ